MFTKLTSLGLSALFSTGLTVAAGFEFHGIGFLPDGAPISVAQGVAPDGAGVTGWAYDQDYQPMAIRWTREEGLIALGDLPGGQWYSVGFGMTDRAAAICGTSISDSGSEAFLWSAGKMTGLGDLAGGDFFSSGLAISRNGKFVTGFSKSSKGSEAFVWTSQNGMVALGDLPGGTFDSSGQRISDDGRIIAGAGTVGHGTEATRWVDGKIESLGMLPGGTSFSTALDMSGDGRWIVGGSSSRNGFEAFRWSQDKGMVGLGDFNGGSFTSAAMGVTADGSTVVGYGSDGIAKQAMIWTADHGMRPLKRVLTDEYGLNLKGWSLETAMGISAEGTVISGWGTDPDGNSQGWVALIPEPGTSFGLLLGTILMRRHRSTSTKP